RILLAIPCLLALLLVAVPARADELEPATPAVSARPDELRFRFGISGSIGVGTQQFDFLPGVMAWKCERALSSPTSGPCSTRGARRTARRSSRSTVSQPS